MAMLAGQMLMQPEVRKGIGKLAKYLLIFGGLGIAVLAFIVLAKKFDPLKAVGGVFGKAFKGVGDFIGKVLGFKLGLLKGVAGLFGGILPKAVPKKLTYEEKVQKWYGGKGEEDEHLRREFRRYAKVVTRQLENLKKAEGIPKEMAGRISMVASAFRRVDKKFVRDIPKQFEVVWNRKREFLRGNLEKSFERAEMIALAEKYAREGKSYASKLTLMEMQRGIMK
ncbi:MAG: hypothetical protein CEE42_05230 [Promethearchaeota archaeon Loki_b31]|nr:MAG: hypothetical protein CEE42_05230 [Candidatus Lokiarchaeota archaeon Loki_b31]